MRTRDDRCRGKVTAGGEGIQARLGCSELLRGNESGNSFATWLLSFSSSHQLISLKLGSVRGINTHVSPRANHSSPGNAPSNRRRGNTGLQLLPSSNSTTHSSASNTKQPEPSCCLLTDRQDERPTNRPFHAGCNVRPESYREILQLKSLLVESDYPLIESPAAVTQPSPSVPPGDNASPGLRTHVTLGTPDHRYAPAASEGCEQDPPY
ncbi:hypothetical protein CBL_06155 [Carabus blaptoides fortunei]